MMESLGVDGLKVLCSIDLMVKIMDWVEVRVKVGAKIRVKVRG
jgi:hypothetical protein